MMKNIFWILAIVLLLGIIALFIWGDRIEPGSVLAGLAAFIAAIKSKLLGNGNLMERIADIEKSHNLKRDEWEKIKQEYDQKYEILKLKMDSLDNRTEIIKQQLQQTTMENYKSGKRSEQEILDWLNRNK